MPKLIIAAILAIFTINASASEQTDYLVQVEPEMKLQFYAEIMQQTNHQAKIKDLQFNNWLRVQAPKAENNSVMRTLSLNSFNTMSAVTYAQKNFKLRAFGVETKTSDCPFPPEWDFLCGIFGPGDGDDGGKDDGDEDKPDDGDKPAPKKGDNPAIPDAPTDKEGADPLAKNQWGMKDIGAKAAQESVANLGEGKEIIVAVIDTGVDYTHEDLLPNLWRNEGEIPGNGIDDDENGFIDDVVGWDFVSDDNLPYDLKGKSIFSGNPGHGTHCAGNVAAKGNNGIGISGVAPNAKIMILRFLSDEGGGTTADAIESIKYAVDNGAHITSNSWGSEGEDPDEPEENKALRDMIQYSQDKGVLFVAAAGNGHQGKGYDNDNDDKPAYPASYDHDIIMSVAAIDVNDKLGSFSNWGKKGVDIAAPGVKVYSTVVGDGYTDAAIPGLATWDGTSMAAPHVSGAAALYMSANPNADWKEVKKAIMDAAKPVSAYKNKLVSGGKLNLDGMF